MVSDLHDFEHRIERAPFRISLLYLIISSLWIGLSDFLATTLAASSKDLIWLQVAKGWGFVIVTSLALFVLLHRFQRTQYRLARSEQQYRRLFEHAYDPILLFSKEGHCIDANPQAEVLTGYSREQLLTLPLSSLAPQMSLQEINRLFKQTKETGFIRQETTLMRRDGAIRWVEYTLVRDTVDYYPVIVRDVTAQKKHLETLQRAALIFHHLTVGILVTDEGGRITDINPAAEKMFGYNKAEMIGQTTGVLYDIQLKKTRVAMMAALQETGSWQGEVKFRRKSSQIGICERVIVPLLDEQNRMIGRISINQDITERKKTEIELRQKNAEMEAVFRAMPDLYLRLDDTGQVLDVKPNLYHALPLPPSDLTYSHIYAVLSPATADTFAQAISPALATKVVTSVQYSFVSSPKVYEARFSALNADEVVALCRDITAYKQAEARLKLQSTLLSAISEASLDGIFVGSIEGKCIYYNHNFVEMWSVPQKILQQDDSAQFAEWVYEQVTEPHKCRADFERLMPNIIEVDQTQIHLTDGRTFDRYSTPLIDEQTHYGRVWYYRDITEKLKLEAQLRQSQKMEAIGRLAGGVAHDFNNILTIIIGKLELVMDSNPDLPTSVQQDLDTVQAAAQRAAKLTSQLLAFSRQQIVQAQPVAINDLIQGLKRLLESMIGDDIVLELALRADPDWVIFDPNQLEQVLFNLVANARDAMPEGGQITIATATVKSDAEEASTSPYVLFTVSDTGRGIDPQTQAKMFDPFFTTKEPGKGTGLGLSIVYGIVTQYEGQITCESRPQQGTRFNICLPRLEVHKAMPVKASPVPRDVSTAQGRKTVMVVDDEDEVRALIVKALKRQGYEVVNARSGGEALTMLETQPMPLDLLVVDVMMPEIYGPELADRIRAQQPDVKVLFLSGFTTKALVRWQIDQNEILVKPFSIQALTVRVQELLVSQK